MNNIATPEQVSLSLLHAARALENKLETALGEVGLSSAKYSALTALVNGPLPLSELAARMSCVRSNITQLVDRLEADGLVKREDDPADRRSIRAAITGLGQHRQKAGAELVAGVQEQFASSVSAADRNALSRLAGVLK